MLGTVPGANMHTRYESRLTPIQSASRIKFFTLCNNSRDLRLCLRLVGYCVRMLSSHRYIRDAQSVRFSVHHVRHFVPSACRSMTEELLQQFAAWRNGPLACFGRFLRHVSYLQKFCWGCQGCHGSHCSLPSQECQAIGQTHEESGSLTMEALRQLAGLQSAFIPRGSYLH